MKATSENADRLFEANLEKVFRYMGDDRTTMEEVERGGKHFVGSFLRGVYPMDEQPPPDVIKTRCASCLTRALSRTISC